MAVSLRKTPALPKNALTDRENCEFVLIMVNEFPVAERNDARKWFAFSVDTRLAVEVMREANDRDGML